MFSKSKKHKSDKPSLQPKLSGMPALKQMRSSKREEYLSKKSKSLAGLEQQRKLQEIDAQHTTPSYEKEVLKRNANDAMKKPDYKKSMPSSDNRVGTSFLSGYVDQSVNKSAPSVVIYEDINQDIPDNVSNTPNGNNEESTRKEGLNRFTNGDSGYKSQSDGKSETDKKRVKKSRKKGSDGKSKATSGLLDIKQQRKASRESVSKSMRALTPKERESIQFLEDVIKVAHEDDSFDEVFDYDSSSNHSYEQGQDIFGSKIDEEAEDAIDYGYASVNDVSRRYSVESCESVGSIIDLVGNLSTGPSSPSSPIYAVVDKSKKTIRESRESNVISKYGDNEATEEIDSEPHFDSHEFDLHEVITHLDEVINSYSVNTDDETEHDATKDEFQPNLEGVDEGSKSKQGMREKPGDSLNERERKERKKKIKDEKKKLKQNKLQPSADEAKLREEHIARHVDEITALTQDMIKTVQRREEPLYAQVDKSKKKNKDINENLEINADQIIDPPPHFRNDPIIVKMPDDNDIAKPIDNADVVPMQPKFNLTSTPLPSPASSDPTINRSHSSLKNEPHVTRGNASKQSNYVNLITPYFNKYRSTEPTRLQMSPVFLQESSKQLKHIPSTSKTGKSMQIDPRRSHSFKMSDNEQAKKCDQVHESTNSNFLRRPQQTRTVRPVSLNLESGEKLTIQPNHSKAYSSFRQDRCNGNKTDDSGEKSRPFVVTALKKSIELC